MTWDQSTAWWVVAGLLVVLELTSGTFYLLMLAVGTAAGALAAHAGLSFPGQLVAAAVIGGAAVTLWHRRRLARPAAPRAAENPDLNLDIGSRVQVEAWGTDRQARVHYRGAAWGARFGGTGTPTPGEHVIVAVEGPLLVLDRPVA
jgi:membrane protein implicated in regulation of membrane protease activity